MNPKCYAYAETGEFVCELDANPDPMNPGNFLYPRNTTLVTPMPHTDGLNIPVFDAVKKTWTLLPDYRGKFGYDPHGQLVYITKAGDPTTFNPPLTKTQSIQTAL